MKSNINATMCSWYRECSDFSTFSPWPHRRCLKRHKFTKRGAEYAVFASSLSWTPAQKQLEIEDEVKKLCIHNKIWILQQACTHYLITCYVVLHMCKLIATCICEHGVSDAFITSFDFDKAFVCKTDKSFRIPNTTLGCREMRWDVVWCGEMWCVKRKWRPPWKSWESRPVAAVSCQTRPK